MLKEAGLKKQQISRNQTLLIAVAPDDVRTNILAFSLLNLSSQQRQQCRTLVSTYKDDFDAMLTKRNDILNHIGGAEDTKRELLAWKISMAKLTREIRHRLYVEILTDEQKREHLKKFPPKKKPKSP